MLEAVAGKTAPSDSVINIASINSDAASSIRYSSPPSPPSEGAKSAHIIKKQSAPEPAVVRYEIEKTNIK